MAKTPKAVSDAVAKTVEDIGKATAEAVKNMDPDSLGGKGQSKGFTTLKDMASAYETVDVFIYRYNEPVKGSEAPAFFVEFRGQPIHAVMSERPEILCKREGGGGLYKVEVVSDDGRHKVEFNKLRVAGTSLPVARSDMEAASVMGMVGNVAGGLPTNSSSPKSNSMDPLFRILETQMKALNQNKGQTNPMNDMMLMAMFQRMQDQQNAVSTPKSAAETETTRKLEEKLSEMERKLEQQQAQAREQQLLAQIAKQNSDWEAKFNKLESTITQSSERSEFKRIEEKIESAKNASNPMTELMTTLLATSQNDKTATQTLFLNLMDKMASKGDSGYQDIIRTMTEQTMTNLNLMTQMAQSGLLGGSGGTTAADVLMKAFEGVEKAATAYIAGMDEEEEEELEEREAGQAQIMAERAEEHRQLQAAQQEQEQGQEQGQKQEQQEADPKQVQESLLEFLAELTPDKIPAEARVTEDELVRVKASQGWRSMLKALREMATPKEATARLYALAEANDKVARRFMTYPVFVGWQILTPLGFGDMVAPVTLDILAFWEFIEEGDGDPNEWCDTYKPVKIKHKDENKNEEGK